MTAELWLEKRCEHGLVNAHDYLFGVVGKVECPGGGRVRLDPEQVVFPYDGATDPDEDGITVADIIDALDQEEE